MWPAITSSVLVIGVTVTTILLTRLFLISMISAGRLVARVAGRSDGELASPKRRNARNYH